MRLSLFLIVLTLFPAFTIAEEAPNPWLTVAPDDLQELIALTPEVFNERWYHVEVMVFARTQPPEQEYWRLDTQPNYPLPAIVPGIEPATSRDTSFFSLSDTSAEATIIDQQTETSKADDSHADKTFPGDPLRPRLPADVHPLFEQAVSHGAWRYLNDPPPLFSSARERMLRTGQYRILFHEHWHQPVFEEHYKPLVIQGGTLLAPLQTDPDDLSLQAIQENPDTEVFTESNDGEALAVDEINQIPDIDYELQGTLTFRLSRFLHVDPSLWYSQDTIMDDDTYRLHLGIEQHRRMRSGETHYIDHPYFGIVLRLTPWDHPVQIDLTQLEKALEKWQTP